MDWFSPVKEKKVHSKVRKEELKNWFVDEDSSSDSSGDSTEGEEGDGNSEEWGNVNRKDKNKKKKKEKKEKEHRRKIETTLKARDMIGLGPISHKDIEECMDETRNFEKAKIKAVENFLGEQLAFEEWELGGVKILSTKMARKEIIYIALGDHDMIRELYSRKAELKNDNITLRTFIPPQYFSRYSAISELCAEKRKMDPRLKTQMRFGHREIEVLVKRKGEDKAFECVDLKDFFGEVNIPKYDATIKWRQQTDKPQRRKLIASPDKTAESAAGKDTSGEPAERQEPTEEQDMEIQSGLQSMRRQMSMDGNSLNSKKTKTTALIEVEDDGSFTTSNGKQNISDIF